MLSIVSIRRKKIKTSNILWSIGEWESNSEKNYFSQIDLQQGKAKNLLEMTILGNGHFMSVL